MQSSADSSVRWKRRSFTRCSSSMRFLSVTFSAKWMRYGSSAASVALTIVRWSHTPAPLRWRYSSRAECSRTSSASSRSTAASACGGVRRGNEELGQAPQQKIRTLVSEHEAERGIDVEDCAVGRGVDDTDRSLLERRPVAGFVVAILDDRTLDRAAVFIHSSATPEQTMGSCRNYPTRWGVYVRKNPILRTRRCHAAMIPRHYANGICAGVQQARVTHRGRRAIRNDRAGPRSRSA